MKKVLAALAAAGVLVAGAFVTAAVSSPSAAVAQEAPEAPESTNSEERPEKGELLDEVLNELVANDVIDADQAAQVKEALQAKMEERRAERGFRGHRRGGEIRGLLDDGVIDADELAGLPEGHPLTDPEGPAADYLEDGELTVDELRQIRESVRGAHGFRGTPHGGEDAADGEDAVLDA